MVLANTASVIAGIACLAIAVSILWKVKPREGRAPSSWMETEQRETVVALGTLTLLVFGIALVATGVLV
jgi:uncharacterized BrkB/YihY/UPF0761 family membrane protein